MWWKWTILVVCGILVVACAISTTYDWIKGKTGPFGPNPENWWGCGIFTIALLAVMYWVGKKLF